MNIVKDLNILLEEFKFEPRKLQREIPPEKAREVLDKYIDQVPSKGCKKFIKILDLPFENYHWYCDYEGYTYVSFIDKNNPNKRYGIVRFRRYLRALVSKMNDEEIVVLYNKYFKREINVR